MSILNKKIFNPKDPKVPSIAILVAPDGSKKSALAQKENNMKTHTLRLAFFIAGLFTLVGCISELTDLTSGQATEDSGATRMLTGTIPTTSATSESASLRLTTNNSLCTADTVIATDTKGETATAEVAEDCSFSLSLTIGKSYAISFAADGTFVATLIFDSGISGFSTSALPVSDGEGSIDLGVVTIEGAVARPEYDPLEHCDQDGDELSDLEDTDDDDDGLSDEEEADCDLDGILDDFDEEIANCDLDEEDPDLALILAVKPYDDSEGWSPVDLEREVKARVDCEIDQATVTTETFYVYAEDETDVIECSYEFAIIGNRMECDHNDQDFLPDTIYIAVIDGVMCTDGRSVEAMSWQWITETEDDDDGCYEDELDDEYEYEYDDEYEDEYEE